MASLSVIAADRQMIKGNHMRFDFQRLPVCVFQFLITKFLQICARV
jgi:hypothetical protein